jgi:aspartate kinase
LIKVMKFGGTSVGDGTVMSKTANIIMENPAKTAVVVSAMSGVTNTLISLMREPEAKAESTLDHLRQKHLDAARYNMTEEQITSYVPILDERLAELKKRLHLYHSATRGHDKKVLHDAISSWGERLSSLTLANILLSKGCDAIPLTSEEAGIMATGHPGNGTADLYMTSINLKARVLPLMERGNTPIITGFYGIGENDQPLTFGRGGSDYSGSVVANGLDADAIEIWTDVDGFMTADPRLVSEAKTLSEMDYNEASELAYFGAKVLHPRTIEPARMKSMDVWVKNTFNPEGKGTRICAVRQGGKNDLSIIKVYSGELMYQPGLVNKILEAICSKGVTPFAISTSLSTLAVLLPSEQVLEVCDCVRAMSDDVQKVNVKDDVSLISAVGDDMLQTCGVSAKIFATVADAGANVEMISEGASDVALNFVVNSEKAVEVIRKLHERYIGG